LRLDGAVRIDALDLQVDVPLVAHRRLGMLRLDLDTDLRLAHVPQHRILGRCEQFVAAPDLEVQVGPAVEEDVAERGLVEGDRERAIAARAGRAEVVVGEEEVLVPGLDAHAADRIAGEGVDDLTADLVAHELSPCVWLSGATVQLNVGSGEASRCPKNR
jgi:hypothetical protein